MASLNQVQLIGNLGGDPEIKTLQGGSKVANFSIATSEKWRDKTTGETKEKTEWHRIAVWSEGLVKVIEQYLKKGSKVYVQGKLQTRKYENEGQDHYATDIVLTGFDCKLVMLGDPNGGDRGEPQGRGDNSRGGGRQSYADRRTPEITPDNSDDDIPF